MQSRPTRVRCLTVQRAADCRDTQRNRRRGVRRTKGNCKMQIANWDCAQRTVGAARRWGALKSPGLVKTSGRRRGRCDQTRLSALSEATHDGSTCARWQQPFGWCVSRFHPGVAESGFCVEVSDRSAHSFSSNSTNGPCRSWRRTELFGGLTIIQDLAPFRRFSGRVPGGVEVNEALEDFGDSLTGFNNAARGFHSTRFALF
jgi:hypothetical protein